MKEKKLIETVVKLEKLLEQSVINQKKIIDILNDMKETKTNNDTCGVSF